MRGIPAGQPPPQPFPPHPAQGSCTEGHGWIWDCSFSEVPAWPCLWPRGLVCHGQCHSPGATCCGKCHFWWPLWCSQSSPCHVSQALGGAALPMWAHQGTKGFLSSLTPGLLRPPCPGPGADGSPLSPGAAVSSREGRGKPPSVASELPGPGGAASDGSSPSGRGWILTRGVPSGWTGTGGPGRTGSPSAPRADGERGLPKLLVLSSATRGRLLEPSPTSLKFLRPSNRKKRKRKPHGVTCFEFITSLKWGSTTDSDPSLSEEDEDNFESSGLRRNTFFFCCFFVS